MIRFVIKKDFELSKLKKYGFVEERDRFVYYTNVVKLKVDKKTRFMSFNQPDNGALKIFYEMVKSDIVAIVDNYHFPKGYHYIGLTDKEFEIIQEMRAKQYDWNWIPKRPNKTYKCYFKGNTQPKRV